MHIVVCVKQVPDWDIPPSSFKVDEAAKKVVPPQGVAPVTSQFDAIAAEAAMKIKDADASTKVTIMSMGPATARDVIKQGLAMGGLGLRTVMGGRGLVACDGATVEPSVTQAPAG